ncbi:extracellular matrix regulator RemB [Amphibacillus sediminis]|uniref:extracellular matrix regulator RemB n=1 Tax=Amphibacillus sediminis TaxID=360185 RepID=UPI00082E692B|nr:extracellular matrix/biofilm biosynthesis regulator RemA family protein [Amphibacillus sediminis]
MFIHIGDDQVIRSDDIIAMIDQQYIASSTINEELIENHEEQEEAEELDSEVTKSIIITKDCVYYSPLSIATLKKRASMLSTLSHLDDYTDSETLEID